MELHPLSRTACVQPRANFDISTEFNFDEEETEGGSDVDVAGATTDATGALEDINNEEEDAQDDEDFDDVDDGMSQLPAYGSTSDDRPLYSLVSYCCYDKLDC